MKTSIQKNTVAFGITCRIIIAAVGGFLLANLVAILISYCLVDETSADNIEGIVTGMMTSFIIYLLAVMFVFSTKSVSRAAFGISITCLAIFGIISTIDWMTTE